MTQHRAFQCKTSSSCLHLGADVQFYKSHLREMFNLIRVSVGPQSDTNMTMSDGWATVTPKISQRKEEDYLLADWFGSHYGRPYWFLSRLLIHEVKGQNMHPCCCQIAQTLKHLVKEDLINESIILLMSSFYILKPIKLKELNNLKRINLSLVEQVTTKRTFDDIALS